MEMAYFTYHLTVSVN